MKPSNTMFLSYFEHMAKLAQIANKKTMFLSYLMYEMEFDTVNKQYYVSLSTLKKKQIMVAVSPETDDSKLLVYADQYLNKLKKAEFIRNIGSGTWLINPKCYGNVRYVSKELREENYKIFMHYEFTHDKLNNVKVEVIKGEG